jgi:hypothetical protein
MRHSLISVHNRSGNARLHHNLIFPISLLSENEKEIPGVRRSKRELKQENPHPAATCLVPRSMWVSAGACGTSL